MKFRLALLVILSAALAGTLFAAWREGQPAAVVSAPEGKFDCVSYTPASRTGDPTAVIDRALIVRDLTLLAQRFRCVRTYSVSEGMHEVPSIARELKLKVLLGFWVGRDTAQNQREIREGLKLAAEYKDVVEAIIVGNEVLLRRDQKAGRLAELIAEVAEATDIPVTYADVWDFWRENPELAPVVNFVTIHLLPYWENQPTGIAGAIRHAADVYDEAHKLFPDKQILIGETGWPSKGRQREDALPSLVNQARFIREFTVWAHDSGAKYNLIEAFDQPWKRAMEGTAGGYWGLLDKRGSPKFDMGGPVIENLQWQRAFFAAAVGGALFVLWGFATRPRRRPFGLLLLLIGGALAGAVAQLQWSYVEAANRTTAEWVGCAVVALLGWGLYLRLIIASSRDGAGLPSPAGLAELLGNLGGNAQQALHGRERGIGLLRFGLLIALTYQVLGLAFDPRYRDFPLSFYALPALALALFAFATPRARVSSLRLIAEEAGLALLIAAGALASAVRETWLNETSLAFALLSGVTAFSVFWAARGLARDHQRREQHADER